MTTGSHRTLLIVVMLCAFCIGAAHAADTRDFEARFGNWPYNHGTDEQTAAIRKEIALIKKALAGVPESQRVSVLTELGKQTKWGTPERAVAYLVSAWYGANYERCRDYLLNSFFWGAKQPYPFIWAEDTVGMLYWVYEKNHDFKLLHDLLTGNSDGAGATALIGLALDAIKNHPRGVLHVADISGKGRKVALSALSQHPNWFFRKGDEENKRIFRAYTTRVAADSKDPLYKTAKSLLEESRRLDAELKNKK